MAGSDKALGVRRTSWRRRALWLAALAALAALAWYWRPMMLQAKAGAAYGARIGCSCRYVAERPLDDCRKDFLPGMALVMLSEDEQARTVTGRVFPLASETAQFREGLGCGFLDEK
jgi:hypothetical protein